jgi:hypothetical protein
MARQQTKGICRICDQHVSKAAMKKHALECTSKHDTGKPTKPAFLMRAEFPYDKRYWLTFTVDASTTLNTIDGFLRGAWLECCGHMSEFSIGGKTRKLKDILEVGMVFGYEYDFGSTTEVLLTVLEEHEVAFGKRSLRLLSINEPIEALCRICGKPATQICTECYDGQEAEVFCDAHSENHVEHQHDDDNYMMASIINSPRTGVCGYDGPGPEAWDS